MSRFPLFFCLAAILFISACSEEKKEEVAAEKKATPPLPVEVITVNDESIPLWISFTGRTEATKRVEVRARIAGRLDTAHRTAGGRFGTGTNRMPPRRRGR